MEDDKETDEHEEADKDDEAEMKKHMELWKISYNLCSDGTYISESSFSSDSEVILVLTLFPLPFIGNFIPRKPDLTFTDEIVKSENLDVNTVVTPSSDKTVESNHESANVKSNGDAVESKTVRKNSFRPPVIEDWNYDNESEEVIKNGNKVIKRTVGETEQEYEPTTAEEKPDRRNEIKARGTLWMALLNKEQLKFYSYKDAKLLMEAIEKSSETMDQAFDRLQKLISQLEIQGEVIAQGDINLKLLRSLPSEWKTRALIWRNKEEIETISLDYLYNNLKIYEPELTGSSSTSQNPQNVAFVSSNSTDSNSNTNEADNTAYGVSAAHTQSSHVNSTFVDNLSDAMICAFLASQPNSP
ncbi:hypothetical protein Tco_0551339 [Tanacetum coccineum]